MARTREQLEYHAAKEREYRARRAQVREDAISALRGAARVLKEQGYTTGMLIDVIEGNLDGNLQGRAKLRKVTAKGTNESQIRKTAT